uniref:C2H2-type domain-containing protein n=2 Tax=Salarias fasciatus TaxID=181472 RepID=A0A672FGW3_SALFA
INMDMVKIEQVIVGGEMKPPPPPPPPEVKPDPVVAPLPAYQHESLQCFQCFITFRNLQAKERHIRKSHRDQYRQHLMQTNTLFTCYKCDRSFKFSEELRQHQVTHNTEERPFRCSYCLENFVTYTDLNKHRRHDCVERKYLCKDCDILFPTVARLRNHRTEIHVRAAALARDLDAHRCHKCSCSFQSDEALQQHLLKYANDMNCGRRRRKTKPEELVGTKKMKQEEDDDDDGSPTEGCSSAEMQIPCSEPDCELVFPSVAALRVHKKEAHGSLQRKAASAEYSCPICGKSFARVTTLKAHQCTHTEGEEETANR